MTEALTIAATQPPRARWEKTVEWPLTVAALLFIAAYAVPVLNPDLSATGLAICRLVERVTWVVFVIDYAVRLYLTPAPRLAWVRRTWVDLVVVVVPILRPLRILRLITMLHTLNRYAGSSVRGKIGVYLAGGTAMIIFIGALAMLDNERGKPGANIETFGDAVWWAMTTVTTVGYGDRFPVTGMGRVIAGAVMVAGIALLGTVTATLASWLIDQVRAERVEAAD